MSNTGMMELIALAEAYEISLEPKQIQQFQIYSDFLLEYNEKVNLTAIRTEPEVMTKHFLDSLLALSAYDFHDDARVLDVGTGAGFPGMPLKIVRPDLELTLLDGTRKRITFLELLEEKLGLSTELIHGRAEELSMDPEYRETYEIVVSRAVANLASLSEYCLPFVELGGVFMALKGPNIEEELENATNALELMGGEIIGLPEFTLPDGDARTIVLIEKVEETPPEYPRQGTNIVRAPL